jgi:hypothetical protein
MRKRIIPQDAPQDPPFDQDWLDLERLGLVEITSEDPAHPIESALLSETGSFWRASCPGEQTIRLVFDQSLRIERIRLKFLEEQHERTQEIALMYSPDGGQTFHLIVRQQYNFSPPETTCEIEEYTVDLDQVTVLELSIVPDISGGDVRASLAGFQLA